MKKLKKLWLIVAMGLVTLASCRKDERPEPQEMPKQAVGDSITFRLSAEIGFEEDEGDLKGLTFRLEDVNGKKIPCPQFANGQEVEVHTILKSSDGIVVAKTLKWGYEAHDKKLHLRQALHNIAIPQFNSDSGRRWYISGLMAPGTTLSGPGNTKVVLSGTRKLLGVSGNAGDSIGELNVPYAFGWTELKIETDNESNNNGFRHTTAKNSTSFQPLGSLIAYRLGNKLTMGRYTFTPRSFTVTSDAYSDQGTFELNTQITGPDPSATLPTWTALQAPMEYEFASDQPLEAIAYNRLGKTYYAWVMSNFPEPARASTRVMIEGESSRPETATYKDYTNTYFTDYTPATGSQGKVEKGKIHTLTAYATRRLGIPIEYVAEYNLAGGVSFTDMTINGVSQQPRGIKGNLRFSNVLPNGSLSPSPHSNDLSGYYNWYEVSGTHDNDQNPSSRNLKTMVDNTFGSDKYFIPEIDHWWGVYPAPNVASRAWTATSQSLDQNELMCVGYGEDTLRLSYTSDYSKAFTSPSDGNETTDDAILYAIRFKARKSNLTPMSHYWDFVNGEHSYPSALDNSMKCAYRYRRKRGSNAWINSNNTNINNRLTIDVVYLGQEEEEHETDIDAISNEGWWSTKQAEGKVISRIFPATGYTVKYTGATSRTFTMRGGWSGHWSASQSSSADAWYVRTNSSEVHGFNAWSFNLVLPVRLFKCTPDVQ